MAQTPRFALPYPEPQHVPDVPKWNGDLANKIEQTLQPIGRSAMGVRHTDDTLGTGAMGNFAATQLTVPAGMLLVFGFAKWGGKNASIRLSVNAGILAGDMLIRHANLGQFTDTLLGAIATSGGVVTASLDGQGIDGDSLSFQNGSAVVIAYLGAGQ